MQYYFASKCGIFGLIHYRAMSSVYHFIGFLSVFSAESCCFFEFGNYSDLFWGKYFELPDDFKIHTSDVILFFGNGLIQNWWVKPGFSETKTMYSIEV